MILKGGARRVSQGAQGERPKREGDARLRNFVNGLYAGRWDMLAMKLDEASAKIRKGQPIDDEEDYALPIWAGLIPVELKALDAIPDPRCLKGVELPAHVKNFEIG
jgi:hypothetical protein